MYSQETKIECVSIGTNGKQWGIPSEVLAEHFELVEVAREGDLARNNGQEFPSVRGILVRIGGNEAPRHGPNKEVRLLDA